MLSVAKKQPVYLDEVEYLTGELTRTTKHEYWAGSIYAMAGASKNHDTLCVNLTSALHFILKQKQSPCKVFSSDMKVKISATNPSYFYPDVLVICDPADNESQYYVQSPILIIEVLSKSTRQNDRTTKRLAYFNIASLQEYVLVEQDYCDVEVFRRKDQWKSMVYLAGDAFYLQAVDATLTVEDIYYQVEIKPLSIHGEGLG